MQIGLIEAVWAKRATESGGVISDGFYSWTIEGRGQCWSDCGSPGKEAFKSSPTSKAAWFVSCRCVSPNWFVLVAFRS